MGNTNWPCKATQYIYIVGLHGELEAKANIQGSRLHFEIAIYPLFLPLKMLLHCKKNEVAE